MGAEYQFGTHATAIYNSQSGGRISGVAPRKQGNVPPAYIQTQGQYRSRAPRLYRWVSGETQTAQQIAQIIVPPQSYDFTLQGRFSQPNVVESLGTLGQEYQFGTHQKAIFDSQMQPQLSRPIYRPIVNSDITPVQTIITYGQELYRDIQVQGWNNIVPVSTGYLMCVVTAGPQIYDNTLSAQFSYYQTKLPFVGPTVYPIINGATADRHDADCGTGF